MGKVWLDSEVEILVGNYSSFGPNECVKLLPNKTKKQITSKASKLGISYNNASVSRYEIDKFSNIVKESISISDVTRKLGLSTGRGNRKTVSKYIDIYKLDTSHFKNEKYNNLEHLKGYDLEDILISGSTYYSTNNLKKKLYKSGLLVPICSVCGQDEYWYGMTISLILDHINGINNDNRIENLRILCPNCNAGQDTFCRGNKK